MLCALAWGIGFVAMKDALTVYPPWWILFFRFTGGAALLWVCFRRRVASLRRSEAVGGAVIGAALFLGMGIQTLGLIYTTAGKQALITATYVVMVPFLVWALRRTSPGRAAIVGSLACFAGTVLLTSDPSGVSALNVGDALTLVSAFFFAAQIIAIRHYAADGDPLTLAFVQMCVVAAGSLVCALAFDAPPVPDGMNGVPDIIFSTLFSTFFAFVVQTYAQKYTSESHAAILLSMEALFGVLSGVVLLGEPMTWRIAAGTCMILASIAVVELAKS
jgi:drug/metabolite transporter (DMT)-like permease